MSPFCVLVVDDYQPWRQMVATILEQEPDWQICEASDGLEAIQKTGELQPDLILLDIGLPQLNGIETARRICAVASHPKILFVSEHVDLDLVREALRTGADGYVVKSEAGSELLTAIAVVSKGQQFVSARFAARFRTQRSDT